jgi:hypothetical protein
MIFFGFFVASMLSWQEKYHYCKRQEFDGKYCETALYLYNVDKKHNPDKYAKEN